MGHLTGPDSVIIYVKILSFIYVCMYICECVCAREYRCPQRPEESVRSPEAGVALSCEPPYKDAENQLRFHKSN